MPANRGPQSAFEPPIGGRTVVIGIGNRFRHDDGVGPAVIDALRARDLGDDVTLVESDGEPTQLLDVWCTATIAIVVDAMRPASPPVTMSAPASAPTAVPEPGRIWRRSLRHPSAPSQALVTSGAASSHGLSLGTAVSLAAALDALPTTLLLFAIEVADTSPGTGLSPAVAAAVNQVERDIITALIN